MKQSHSVLAVASLLAASWVGTSQAQIKDNLVVKIPFNYVVGSSSMPSGEYRLKPHHVARGAFWIQSEDGKKAVLFQTFGASNGGKQHNAELIFNKYGNDYFLSQVWTGTDNVGRHLSQSAIEKEAASRLSESHMANASEPVKVVVAFNRPR